MNNISRLIFTSLATIMVLGIVGCSTTKEQPAPPAPEPVVEQKAEPVEPVPAAEPPPPAPVLEPKPDRG